MSLSRREEKLARNKSSGSCRISAKNIAEALKAKIPYIDFACLLGSAGKGEGAVRKGSDIDLAVYFSPEIPASWDKISDIISTVENLYPGFECDLGILNDAGPTYRFEAIKGKLLFVREDKIGEYAEFYSLTCREYEEMMAAHRKYYFIGKESRHA